MPLDKSQCMAARLVLREQESFIIDTLFPAGAVHLIGGNSGVGKTTFLLRMMYEWEQRKRFLERYTCHPCPWVYIAADRHRLDTDRTLRRIGLADWDLPLFSVEDCLKRNPKTNRIAEEASLELVFAHFPDTALFVIEGFQSFIPDAPKGRGQNKHEQIWMSTVRDLLLQTGRTIIGTTHAPKASGEKTTDPRAGFLGSQSLIGACSTMVSIETPEQGKYKRNDGNPASSNLDRVVRYLPRDAPNHVALYTRGDNGEFLLDGLNIESKDAQPTEIFENENDQELRMSTYINATPRGEEMTTELLVKWAEISGMSVRSMERWIKKQIELGVIRRATRGKYERPREN